MPKGILSNVAKGTARMRGTVPLFAGLLVGSWVFGGSSLQAEILYDRYGIQLLGTARIITYNAATCHVLKESLPESRYEELKAHDGQPLHVWQLDYAVRNWTERGLSYLRADFDLESEYPPCSNWTGEGPGNGATGSERYSGPVQWGNQSRTLSAPAGMGSGEVKDGVLYLAVYHTHRPSFRRSSVHFTFGEPDQTAPPPTEKAAASPHESGPDRGQEVRTRSPSSFQNEPTCAGQPEGTACWMELYTPPGCYVWNPYLHPDTTATWTGECAEGLAQGTGTLNWFGFGGKTMCELTEPLQVVKYHGQWGWLFPERFVEEGPYVKGKKHGRWVMRFADRDVSEGPYVKGKKHGRWVKRVADRDVFEGPYVKGEKHGRWVERFADRGEVSEGPYVKGEKHGRWVERFADRGEVSEGPYVKGKKHGRWVMRFAGGDIVMEGSYVADQKHGAWTEGPWRGIYVEGKKHGRWVKRDDDGQIVEQGRYVEDKRDGTWTLDPGGENERPVTYDRSSTYDRSQVDPIRPEMVEIPGGSFRMGCVSGRDCNDDEQPVHEVRVEAFELGKYEVTFEEYDRFTATTGRAWADDEGLGRGRRPVINVLWEDAVAYTRWLSGQTGERYRLPSEAEWEYAVRAGTETAYSWGNEIGSNRANCDGCGRQWDGVQTAPVGSFSPNGWGLHDLHGNVLEWVQDCWNGSYQGAPTNGSAWESGDCSLRVLRGGSWIFRPRYLRSASRLRGTTANRIDLIGFRVARTIIP